ncbi:DoxX family protein [Lichenihabitans sp. Uapishka_5]|uniref:DoxX family protein n=1 Tax=Lichenihabitans sp. Uapishka_5 TaxID=3037302 RepID=UPI0029E80030|nr:DoxX family protein [Lichenihabitans sp. Uapishka_5]MDX7950858.1 DoxX family protein [Lichenihabitans sp. Uapishka_5]
MTLHVASPSSHLPGRGLTISLWIAQGLICLAFVAFGGMKLFLPIDRLAAMWVWPGQVPPWFLHGMGVLDVAGGIGVLLPALTRIQPRLTVVAAICCTVLQMAAITFHVSRDEAFVTPLNFVLLALCAFIAWGRGTKVRIAARP